MSKELYLYSSIYSYTAESLMSQIDDEMGNPVSVRVYSGGGEVEAGYGICAKLAEHGNVTLKVDGAADSMAAFMLLYAKNVECLDVSTFIMHRAAYSSWVDVTDAMQASLDKMNKDLKSKMLAKVDPAKFLEATGVSIDQMFNAPERMNIELNAKQAKKIGLVNKVNTLSPAEAQAFQTRLAAAFSPEKPKPKNTMTLAELKAAHPEAYAAAIAEGVAQGIAQEKDRVEACLVYNEIDPAGVKAAIEAGKPLSQKQMAEFSLKSQSAAALEKLKADNAKPVTPGAEAPAPVEKTAAEKEKEDFSKNLTAHMKQHKIIA